MVGKPGVGRNMVLCCACVFVCVWQLQPSCPWQCCCNQANQGRLPAFFTPLGSLPAAHRHTHTHTRRFRDLSLSLDLIFCNIESNSLVFCDV